MLVDTGLREVNYAVGGHRHQMLAFNSGKEHPVWTDIQQFTHFIRSPLPVPIKVPGSAYQDYTAQGNIAEGKIRGPARVGFAGKRRVAALECAEEWDERLALFRRDGHQQIVERLGLAAKRDVSLNFWEFIGDRLAQRRLVPYLPDLLSGNVCLVPRA